MKYLLIFITFVMFFVSNSIGQNSTSHDSSQPKSLSDSLFFDLSQATYTTVNNVNFIEIPVWIKSTNTSINSFDFWFQFNLNKLTYVSTTSLVTGLDAFSNFNTSSSYLSNTSSGSSINFLVPLLTNLVKLKFSISGQCTTILPSDFYNITALVNGDLSSNKVIENNSSIEIVTSNPLCTNSPITFNCASSIYGKPIQNYLWNFGNNISSSNATDSTTYISNSNYLITLNITTNDGCVFNLSKQISVSESPQSSFTSTWTPNLSSAIFSNTSSINNGSITSYFWDFGDGSTSSDFNVTHTYGSLGVYLVSLNVLSNLGCSSSFTQQISNVNQVEENDINEIGLFPNPTDLSIVIPVKNSKYIYVLDCLGRLLFSKEITNNIETFELSTMAFESGRYFIEIHSDKVVSRGSFVVKH